MKKINIGLIGASGKMGQAVRESLDLKTMIPYLAISSKKCLDFKNNFNYLEEISEDVLNKVDVWIEFSSIQILMQFCKKFQKSRTRIVSGTTGLTKTEFKKLLKLSKSAAVFWSSNMSSGLWALRQSLKALSEISDFEFSIEETHHLQKKDNPSGTALTLKSDLEKILKKKIKTPVGIREADVFGIHTIKAQSKGEILTFEHAALNRSVFAQGALKAATFLVKKKQGFYSMEDLNSKTLFK